MSFGLGRFSKPKNLQPKTLRKQTCLLQIQQRFFIGAELCPLFKNGDSNYEGNFRPLSVLPVTSKIKPNNNFILKKNFREPCAAIALNML